MNIRKLMWNNVHVKLYIQFVQVYEKLIESD